MKQPVDSWKSILGNKKTENFPKIFDHLVNTGNPWSRRPEFCTENEGLPYELVVTDEHPLFVSGVMKFNVETAEWECHGVDPMVNDAPVSVWEITGIDTWKGQDKLEGTPPRRISLVNTRGKEIYVDCPAYITMRESVQVGKKFRFSLYLIASFLQREESSTVITEGPLLDKERERRAKADKDFKPEDLTQMTLDLSAARALLQGEVGTDFLTRVDKVEPLEFMGNYGYKITGELAGKGSTSLPVELYVFESVLNKYIPKEGDLISGSGMLYGLPVEEAEQEKDISDFVSRKGEEEDPEDTKELREFMENYLELPLATKVIMATFIRTGWEIVQSSTKFFSKMVPAFLARKKGGSTYAVFVDMRKEGKYEYPDVNQKEIDDINARCREHNYKVIRFRIDAKDAGKIIKYNIQPVGQFPQKLAFNMDVLKLSRKIPAAEVVKQAISAFADTVNNSDMIHVAAWLDEDIHFMSQTVGTDIYGKITFLRYFSVVLARWQQHGKLPQAVLGTISWKNRRQPCMALMYEGEVTSCTVMRARNGFISEMLTLPEDVHSKFKPL